MLCTILVILIGYSLYLSIILNNQKFTSPVIHYHYFATKVVKKASSHLAQNDLTGERSQLLGHFLSHKYNLIQQIYSIKDIIRIQPPNFNILSYPIEIPNYDKLNSPGMWTS